MAKPRNIQTKQRSTQRIGTTMGAQNKCMPPHPYWPPSAALPWSALLEVWFPYGLPKCGCHCCNPWRACGLLSSPCGEPSCCLAGGGTHTGRVESLPGGGGTHAGRARSTPSVAGWYCVSAVPFCLAPASLSCTNLSRLS